MKDDENRKPTFLNWLGITERPDLSKARPLGAMIGVLLILILLTAIGAAFAVLISTYGQAFSDSGPSLGAGTLIIGLLGAPFLIWRTIVAQRTVDIAQENHITDLINKAVEGLGAFRTERQGFSDEDGLKHDENGVPIILETTKPNIEVRIGAILALERLAKNNPEVVHIQIMEILTAYIRQNSPVATLKPSRTPFNRPKPRSDIQLVLSVLGRRSVQGRRLERDKQFRLNLSDCDLSGADLTDAELSAAILIGSRLEGTYFRRANLSGAWLGSGCIDFQRAA